MIQRRILDTIRAYDTVILFRHIRIDGDCVGATKGLARMLQLTFPQKTVLIADSQRSEHLSFLGHDDAELPDSLFRGALGVVIDTATADRISDQRFRLCEKLVKIDHHIEREPYGDINWVEEERSSACEMIAEFYRVCADELHIDKQAAEYIYTGMVTDSGRFQYEGVSGETMRLAGLMLDQGVDAEHLYANLYLRDFDSLRFKAHVYSHMQLSENGVASIYISLETQKEFGISFEEACAAVGYLDGIRGCLCWLAFIETGDEKASIRVRLRSRFLPINELAEAYRGGGHANASGATVFGENEVQELTSKADAMVKQYKETHEGWL